MKHKNGQRRALSARQSTIDDIVKKMHFAVENHEKRVLHDEMRERHHIREWIKCYVQRVPAQVGVWKGGC